MTSTSSFSTNNFKLRSYLSNISKKVINRTFSHITLENIYVVSLITSWSSAVILILLIVGGLLIYLWIPTHLSETLTNALAFLGSVTNGYMIGIRNLPPSKRYAIGGSLETMMCENVQWFYSFPWKRLQSLLNADSVLDMLPILSEVAPMYSNIYDLIWLVSAKISTLPFIKDLSTNDYCFASSNDFPRMFLFIIP